MNKGLTVRINVMPMSAITGSENMRANSLIRDIRATLTNLNTNKSKTVSGWGNIINTFEEWQRGHLKDLRNTL